MNQEQALAELCVLVQKLLHFSRVLEQHNIDILIDICCVSVEPRVQAVRTKSTPLPHEVVLYPACARAFRSITQQLPEVVLRAVAVV